MISMWLIHVQTCTILDIETICRERCVQARACRMRAIRSSLTKRSSCWITCSAVAVRPSCSLKPSSKGNLHYGQRTLSIFFASVVGARARVLFELLHPATPSSRHEGMCSYILSNK